MALDRMSIVTMVDDDLLGMVMELHRNGQPLGHINVDPSGLDALIHGFAARRAELLEEVPWTLEPGARVQGIADPAMRVVRKADGSAELYLRHPGFGWLLFALPASSVERLTATIAEAPSPTKGQRVNAQASDRD